jgi:glycosyltransferase involved in cell wall biosynthesis
MRTPKVLYVCHNHPEVRPGGAETYALELYRAVREAGEFDPIFLAKGGPPLSDRRPHPGTRVGPAGHDPDQYFFFTDGARYDWFYGTFHDKEVYTRDFRDFLTAHRPDVVHFQHTLALGYDMLREARNTLPEAPLVYTLHEYLPICHRHGQLVRAPDNQPCPGASPARCHECFPDISAATFFRRRHFILAHLSFVDVFLAPSRFLLERYAEWGIPREKLRLEEYGRLPARPLPVGESLRDSPTGTERGRHDRLGYFGQVTPYKGVEVLLKAMRILGEEAAGLARTPPPGPLPEAERGSKTGFAPPLLAGEGAGGEGCWRGPHLWVHGANLDMQPGPFQEEIRSLLDAARGNVTLVGRYDHGQLPRLMAGVDWVVVPSVWPENSPLVIQEAFQHGRPVICSNIGGMAEKVADGVSGLHFRAGDPTSLAATLRRAADDPGLWRRLREGIPEVHRMEEHVASLARLYHTLLRARRGQG